ncbi:MAG: hypothetical protein R8K47_00490, partial [Mariprofundaceae bacterium]
DWRLANWEDGRYWTLVRKKLQAAHQDAGGPDTIIFRVISDERAPRIMGGFPHPARQPVGDAAAGRLAEAGDARQTPDRGRSGTGARHQSDTTQDDGHPACKRRL